MEQTSVSSLSSVLTLVHGLSTLVSVVGQIVLLMTVAGVVRRNRPDAYGTLLVWASASLGASLLFSIVGTLGGVVAGRRSIESMMTFQIVSTAIHIPISIALFATLAVGLSRLAQPRVEPVVRGEPPYR